MKSERRHELERNQLADWLGKRLEALKPYQNAIFITVIVVVTVLLGYTWWSQRSAATAEIGWDEFYQALSENNLDPARFENIVEQYPGTRLADCAATVAGDLRLAMGCNALFLDKATAQQELGDAVDHYKAVLRVRPTWSDAAGYVTRGFLPLAWYLKLPIALVALAVVFGLVTIPARLGSRLARELAMPEAAGKITVLLGSVVLVVVIVLVAGLPSVLGLLGRDITPVRLAMLHERATFGLARALEAQGDDLEEAEQYYRKVTESWPDGAYALVAKRQLDQLEKPSAGSWYDRFAEFDPKPAAEGPDEPPPFDLDSLPEDEPLFEPKIRMDLEEKGAGDSVLEEPAESPQEPGATETDAKVAPPVVPEDAGPAEPEQGVPDSSPPDRSQEAPSPAPSQPPAPEKPEQTQPESGP